MSEEVTLLGGTVDPMKGWRRPPEGKEFHCYAPDKKSLCGRFFLPFLPDNFAPNGTDGIVHEVCAVCATKAPFPLPTAPDVAGPKAEGPDARAG